MSAEHDPKDPRPIAPREPEAGECCGSDCNPCVYDRYLAALDRHEAALHAWEQRRIAKNVGASL